METDIHASTQTGVDVTNICAAQGSNQEIHGSSSLVEKRKEWTEDIITTAHFLYSGPSKISVRIRATADKEKCTAEVVRCNTVDGKNPESSDDNSCPSIEVLTSSTVSLDDKKVINDFLNSLSRGVYNATIIDASLWSLYKQLRSRVLKELEWFDPDAPKPQPGTHEIQPEQPGGYSNPNGGFMNWSHSQIPNQLRSHFHVFGNLPGARPSSTGASIVGSNFQPCTVESCPLAAFPASSTPIQTGEDSSKGLYNVPNQQGLDPQAKKERYIDYDLLVREYYRACIEIQNAKKDNDSLKSAIEKHECEKKKFFSHYENCRKAKASSCNDHYRTFTHDQDRDYLEELGQKLQKQEEELQRLLQDIHKREQYYQSREFEFKQYHNKTVQIIVDDINARHDSEMKRIVEENDKTDQAQLAEIKNQIEEENQAKREDLLKAHKEELTAAEQELAKLQSINASLLTKIETNSNEDTQRTAYLLKEIDRLTETNRKVSTRLKNLTSSINLMDDSMLRAARDHAEEVLSLNKRLTDLRNSSVQEVAILRDEITALKGQIEETQKAHDAEAEKHMRYEEATKCSISNYVAQVKAQNEKLKDLEVLQEKNEALAFKIMELDAKYQDKLKVATEDLRICEDHLDTAQNFLQEKEDAVNRFIDTQRELSELNKAYKEGLTMLTTIVYDNYPDICRASDTAFDDDDSDDSDDSDPGSSSSEDSDWNDTASFGLIAELETLLKHIMELEKTHHAMYNDEHLKNQQLTAEHEKSTSSEKLLMDQNIELRTELAARKADKVTARNEYEKLLGELRISRAAASKASRFYAKSLASSENLHKKTLEEAKEKALAEMEEKILAAQVQTEEHYEAKIFEIEQLWKKKKEDHEAVGSDANNRSGPNVMDAHDKCAASFSAMEKDLTNQIADLKKSHRGKNTLPNEAFEHQLCSVNDTADVVLREMNEMEKCPILATIPGENSFKTVKEDRGKMQQALPAAQNRHVDNSKKVKPMKLVTSEKDKMVENAIILSDMRVEKDAIEPTDTENKHHQLRPETQENTDENAAPEVTKVPEAFTIGPIRTQRFPRGLKERASSALLKIETFYKPRVEGLSKVLENTPNASPTSEEKPANAERKTSIEQDFEMVEIP